MDIEIELKQQEIADSIARQKTTRDAEKTVQIGTKLTEKYLEEAMEDPYSAVPFGSDVINVVPYDMLSAADKVRFNDREKQRTANRKHAEKVNNHLNSYRSFFPQEPTISTRDDSSVKVAEKFVADSARTNLLVHTTRSEDGRHQVADVNGNYTETILVPVVRNPLSNEVTEYKRVERRLDPTNPKDARTIAIHKGR